MRSPTVAGIGREPGSRRTPPACREAAVLRRRRSDARSAGATTNRCWRDTPEQTASATSARTSGDASGSRAADAHPGIRHGGSRSPDPGSPPGFATARSKRSSPRTGVRRDELATLAEIGALNAFGHHRRSALWQIERAVRPSGELFREDETGRLARRSRARSEREPGPGSRIPAAERRRRAPSRSAARAPSADRRAPTLTRPLAPDDAARTADGRLCRHQPDHRPASAGAAARRAGAARRPARARSAAAAGTAGACASPAPSSPGSGPGTAKGFVFLTLEDETGIANIIVRPDLFTEQRAAIVGAPYLLVEGTLQMQEGVTSIKAERVLRLAGEAPNRNRTISDSRSLAPGPFDASDQALSPADARRRGNCTDLSPRAPRLRRCPLEGLVMLGRMSGATHYSTRRFRGCRRAVAQHHRWPGRLACQPGPEIDAARPRRHRRSSPQLWIAARPKPRDLFWGVGGRTLAPDPAARYTVIEIKRSGFSHGYTVIDPQRGASGAPSFPPEAATEVVASRILWGIGYHQPPIYLPDRLDRRQKRHRRTRSCRPASARSKPDLHGLDAEGHLVVLPQPVRRHARSCTACSCCRPCSATPT